MTYFGTATSNRGLEKILHSVVNTPAVLKFQSEYELVNSVSPLEGGKIRPCSTKDEWLEAMEDGIVSNYDERPIIVIVDEVTQERVLEILDRNNFGKYKIGASPDNLKEIRQWEYGVLILGKHDGVGLNTRFAKDAIVLIGTKVDNKAQYEQFLGRSSRTRGICRGIYFCESNLTATQIMDNLNVSNLMFLQNLGILLKFLEFKQTNQTLLNALETALDGGDKITSMKDIQTILEKKQYNAMTKGFHYWYVQ